MLKPIFKKETLRVYNDFNKKALGNYAYKCYKENTAIF